MITEQASTQAAESCRRANAQTTESAVDPFVSEHEFPYRWYTASITGKFSRWDEKRETVHTRNGNIDYGFARSLEAGEENWQRTRKLKPHTTAAKLTKK